MCVPCVLQVSRAFTFKQQCRRSNETLKSFIGEVDKTNEPESTSICDSFENVEPNNAEAPLSGNVVGDIVTDEIKSNVHQFTVSNQTESETLHSVLPSKIECSSYGEEMELSSLPGNSQFSTVSEAIQEHLTGDALNDEEDGKICKDKDVRSKFDDYFDEINVVSLAEDELPDQSIEEETFGKMSMF